MMSSMTLPARSLVALGLVTQLASAVSVTDVFTVKTGTGGGSCDGQNIDGWFADSLTLVSSAVTGAAATDTDSRKYLTTFFSIKPTDDASQAGNVIGQVNEVVSNTALPPGGKPWLFCSSDWLQQQAWTDVAYDPETGAPRSDGKTIQSLYENVNTNGQALTVKIEVPFWSSDLSQYVVSEPGDYCGSSSLNMAATQDQTTPSTVTLCTANFDQSIPDTLSGLSAVTAAKVSISTLQTRSLNLFHELFHLTEGTAATPDVSYALNSIVRLGTANAIKNPETYTLYALAYYLGQQNTGFTFANSKSVVKAS